MMPIRGSKTLVQCDFDGTVTEEDVSFLILDAFADGNWRQLLAQYKAGEISVGRFNTRAFTMVKEDEPTLRRFVKEVFKLRAGFQELIDYCRGKGYRLVIVSNGLDFYIKTILETAGIDDIEVFAAKARFSPDGVEACYLGPEGNELQDGFKETYIRHFISQGYRVIYLGNGDSDIPSARLAKHVFATGQLFDYCQGTKLKYTPFASFNDVVKGLELLG
jgi:2-hydroxy-3-keto-5-methylthiopentenyl-1-phosphate phosphatase